MRSFAPYRCLFFALIVASPLTYLAAGDEKKEPDLSTPQAAAEAFQEAQLRGDGAAMKSIALYNAEWARVIDAEIVFGAAKTRLHKAAVAKWGDVLTNMNFRLFTPEPVPEDYVYTITGDIAVFGPKDRPHFIIKHFKRVDGKWKVDLTASEPGLSMVALKLMRKVSQVTSDYATKVENGEFKTAKEAADMYKRTLDKR